MAIVILAGVGIGEYLLGAERYEFGIKEYEFLFRLDAVLNRLTIALPAAETDLTLGQGHAHATLFDERTIVHEAINTGWFLNPHIADFNANVSRCATFRRIGPRAHAERHGERRD